MNGVAWRTLDNHSRKINVLNKNRVLISFHNNLILKRQWNDKVIQDIFGKIGPIADFHKNDNKLTINFKKSQSDKARRVLLYLFDLPVMIADEVVLKNSKYQPNPNDIFNPVQYLFISIYIQFCIEYTYNT